MSWGCRSLRSPGCLEMNEVSCLFGGDRKFPSKSEPVWGEWVSWEVLGLVSHLRWKLFEISV